MSGARTDSGPSVDAVIVNWNAGAHLVRAVRSAIASIASAAASGTVFVVDNGSTDDSLAPVEALRGPVEVIRTGHNLGYAGGIRVGAARSRSELLLILNPDVELRDDTVRRVLAVLAERPDVGVVGARLVDPQGVDGISCYRFPSLSNMMLAMSGLDRFAGRLPGARLKTHAMVERDPAQSGVVDQVIGAFMLIRREAWDAVGGIDDSFFLYYEEVDLCRRIRDAGWLTWYCAEAVATHVGQVSSSQVPDQRLAWLWESRERYARRHLLRWEAEVITWAIPLVEVPMRVAYAASQRRPAAIADALRGCYQWARRRRGA